MENQADEKLALLIQGCMKNDRKSQQLLYKHLYGYAMSICLRYSQNQADAVEILNDGFLKVFTKMEMYNTDLSFKGWVRRILINTAVDHYRRNVKHYHHQEIENRHDIAISESALSDLSTEDILRVVQLLSPVYRTVFNLYVIDGYNHEEIAEMLNISEGTSKSNLSKARANLRAMLKKVMNEEEYERFTR